ncbi:MAG: hypothetical protein M0R51_11870 [Clostridia bacterium]|jgi:hypothetical protein|nr:hypothetical protein [Clostridia bacterium]
MLTFNNSITDFFQEYIHFPKEYYTESGDLTDSATNIAALMLLHDHVFESKKEMKTTALKDFNVILPEHIFKEA